MQIVGLCHYKLTAPTLPIEYFAVHTIKYIHFRDSFALALHMDISYELPNA